MSMSALKITAHLENGFSAADPWSPALDAIIAYIVLKERFGIEQFSITTAMGEQTTVDDLPLEKINHDDRRWWWACSLPEYDKQFEINRAYFKKFNIDTALIIQRKVKTIELTKNQFKNYSLTFRHIATKQISWHVIGDESAIMDALAQCEQVGANRGKGCGAVKKWSISAGDAQKARHNRILPADYADANDIAGIKMWRGFRPSFRIPENQCLCIIPQKISQQK